ncbi:MAG: hypothetical protein AAFP02_24120 [Bacteroidota bacterium]
MQSNRNSSAHRIRETIVSQISPTGLELLISIAVPVYLVSEEYVGLPREDRLEIMNAITGLWEITHNPDTFIKI